MFCNIRLLILIGVISLVTCGSLIGTYVATAQTPSSIIPLTIDGIECNANEQFLFHIHAHLNIFVNGQLMYVPPQIGIIPEKCIYWLHTHDETGIIHIESPIKRDFTLGQFFDLWKKKLENPQIFDNIFNEKGSSMPQIYINGNKLPNGTNYRDVKLHAHDEIALVYGTSPSHIPSRYDFPQGL
ncbi:MAG TPA: hypothetical protein VE593_09955 [Nitrososphaeraceae archaeon]|jgi:hypothetical protein|nr:hypothetical protein [Nitrososphaeraceae archaeon]